MKAGVLYNKDDIRYEDIQKPLIESNKVMVKVKYTGICGSDIPRVNDGTSHYFPNILGHEFSGTVCDIGENVTSVKVGDRVSGIPLVPCLSCNNCQRGNYALCNKYSFIGSREYGAFAEYVCVNEKNVVKFDDNISFEIGAFFEPATIALHGINRLNGCQGKNVAILGCGSIGIFTLQLAKIFGAKNITAFDIDEDRLNIAKSLGADHIINTSEDNFLDNSLKNIDIDGYDRVFETAGNPITIRIGFDIIANKGEYCLIGTPTTDVNFSHKQWEFINRKEFTLTGSWMSYSAPFPGEEWELISHYFKKNLLKFDERLIFKKIPLSDISTAFKMYKKRGYVKGKILIDVEA